MTPGQLAVIADGYAVQRGAKKDWDQDPADRAPAANGTTADLLMLAGMTRM